MKLALQVVICLVGVGALALSTEARIIFVCVACFAIWTYGVAEIAREHKAAMQTWHEAQAQRHPLAVLMNISYERPTCGATLAVWTTLCITLAWIGLGVLASGGLL